MPGRPPSAKTKFNQRLHREGRWEQFLLRREEIKRNGVSDREAWKVAGTEFPPLDGSPLEFEPPDSVATVAPSASKPRKAPADFAMDGSGISAADLDDTSEPPAPGLSVRESIKAYHEQHVRDATARSPSLAGEFAELVSRMDKSKTPSELDVVRWVLHNLLVSPSEMDPEEVPGMAAISVLKWVKQSGANMSEFMRIWAKIIPSKSELEVQDRFRDTGKRQFDLLDQFDEQFAAGDELSLEDGVPLE